MFEARAAGPETQVEATSAAVRGLGRGIVDFGMKIGACVLVPPFVIVGIVPGAGTEHYVRNITKSREIEQAVLEPLLGPGDQGNGGIGPCAASVLMAVSISALNPSPIHLFQA